MKFVGDKITFTLAMKSFAEDTLKKKLGRVLPEPKSVDVKLSKLNNEKLKVDLSVDRFRAQAIDEDFYVAVGKAATKIKSIVLKNTKKDKRSRVKIQVDTLETAVEETETSRLLSKEKTFDLQPITIEEAINELDYTDYMFYVFKNIGDDNNISIVYRRLNGDYGLIKCR